MSFQNTPYKIGLMKNAYDRGREIFLPKVRIAMT
jgi:hypothetical protein